MYGVVVWSSDLRAVTAGDHRTFLISWLGYSLCLRWDRRWVATWCFLAPSEPKCRKSLGLVAWSCILSGCGTSSPGVVAAQCKQFYAKTLTSFAIVVHATYYLITPSGASYALCPIDWQCASTHICSCISTARSGSQRVLLIILIPQASTCCDGSSRRAVAFACWFRSFSWTALFCASRISFFDGNSTVS
jgi:hypothetical protein